MAEIREVKISEVFIDEDFNCRGFIAPIDVVDLAKDIDRQGLIQPVLVCELSDELKAKFPGYTKRLLAGFRRFKAHIVLKRETIPAVVRFEVVAEADARILNLAENLHRKDLNVLQEAKAIRPLFIMGLTEDKVAVRLGQSRGWVQIRAMLLKLPEEVQKEVEAGMIGHVNIRELYQIHKAGNMDNLYRAVRDIKDKKLRGIKKVTVNPNIVCGDQAENKRLRDKKEMERLTEFLVKRGLRGLHTRCIAWCAGHISMADLIIDIKAYADDNGLPWTEISQENVNTICER